MVIRTPRQYFLAAGCADGATPLNSFDAALLAAGVGDTNIVKMTSILPPRCQPVDPVKLPYGALVPVAYAAITGDLPGEVLAAAVAIAIPKDPERPGLIMEYSARGHREEADEIVRSMARQGLEHRGLELDRIESIATQHRVGRIGSAFAGVVLWDDRDL